MANIIIEWEEIPEFGMMAAKVIEHYPNKFSQIDPHWLIAYGISNKDRPEGKRGKPWDISGSTEPESFTNTKKYFLTTFLSYWNACSEELKYGIVLSMLERIDSDHPDSGRLKPYDYKDQGVMVRTFGVDWERSPNLPHLLKTNVELIEE